AALGNAVVDLGVARAGGVHAPGRNRQHLAVLRNIVRAGGGDPAVFTERVSDRVGIDLGEGNRRDRIRALDQPRIFLAVDLRGVRGVVLLPARVHALASGHGDSAAAVLVLSRALRRRLRPKLPPADLVVLGLGRAPGE